MDYRKHFTHIVCLLALLLIGSYSSKALGQTLKDIPETLRAKLGINDTKRDYFNGQFLKGKRNGMGVLLGREKKAYIGDFSDGALTGSGILVQSDGISNCPGSYIYVGKLAKGKKSGKGRCYAENGELLYSGEFEADKPIETYPESTNNAQKYFTTIVFEDGSFFLGEMSGAIPDGLGAIVFSNGDLMQGRFKDGERKGIGLYLTPEGEWETDNVKNGVSSIVSSSESYRAIDESRIATNREYLSEVRQRMSEALLEAAQLAENIASASSPSSEASASLTSGSSTDNHSGRKTKNSGKESKSSNTHSLSEITSKSIDQRTYEKWEYDLIHMNTYYERDYSDSQRRYIQQHMKDIRTRWEQRGFKMYHSDWEEWDGRKRGL